jgi:hypothetical protein
MCSSERQAAAELLGVATQKIIFIKGILLCYDVSN